MKIRRIRVLDCYSDPLGWKCCLRVSDDEASVDKLRRKFTNLKNIDGLVSLVLDLGKGVEGSTIFGFRFLNLFF